MCYVFKMKYKWGSKKKDLAQMVGKITDNYCIGVKRLNCEYMKI